MKLILNVVGVVIALPGLIFALQGIGILQGSSMSNQVQWLLIGLVMVVIGVGLIVVNRRQSANGKQ